MAVATRSHGLDSQTRRLFECLRKEKPANRAFGLPVEVAQALAVAVVARIAESSGLARVLKHELRWFAEDVGRALSSGRDEDLAFELEGVLRKWLDMGLEKNTVQLLMRILCREMAGLAVENKSEVRDQRPEVRTGGQPETESAPKARRHEGEGPNGAGP